MASVFDGAKPGDVFCDSHRFLIRGACEWLYYSDKDATHLFAPPDDGTWQKITAPDLGDGVTVEREGDVVTLKFDPPVGSFRYDRASMPTDTEPSRFKSFSFRLAPPAPALPPLPTWLRPEGCRGVVKDRKNNYAFVLNMGSCSMQLAWSDGSVFTVQGELDNRFWTHCDPATHAHYGITLSDELRAAMGGGNG